MNKKYDINRNIFEVIDSPEKAYWLGFLYADGYVSQNKVEITLSSKDLSHADLFRRFMGLPKEYRIMSLREGNYCRVDACGRKIVDDLIDKGCFNKKTHTLRFPTEEQVPKELQSHFIRGYFDGDGSIGCYKYKERETLIDFRIEGNEPFLTSVQSILIRELGLNKTLLYRRHKDRDHNIRTLKYSGRNNIRKIFDFLYKSSPISLERKSEKFKEILSYKLLTR